MRVIKVVGLLLLDPDGRALMFTTSKDMPDFGRAAGTISIPTRQIRDGETNDQALVRLIAEDVDSGHIIVPPTFYKEFEITPSDELAERLVLYVGKCELPFAAKPSSAGIEFFGWMPPHAILRLSHEQKGPEIEPIISSYFA